MASSNLKSLVLKLSTTAAEPLNPAAFSYLYQAIKEIVDYWSDYSILQDDKDLYLLQHGLTKFIDISGAISVTFCYSNELSYICKWVNGSSSNMSDPLSISVTSGFYLNFADPYWKEVMENTFYKNKLSGVIVTSQIDDNKGISTQDILSYSFIQLKYTPGEDDRIDYFYGVNKEAFSDERAFTWHQGDLYESWRENKKIELANRFDYFLKPNPENNLANIKIMDFTPFARIIEKWNKYPLIITADRVLGPQCCKQMDEFWLYIPSQANRGINPSYMMCDSDDNDGRSIFEGEAYITTFNKMYFFVAEMSEGNIGHSYYTTTRGASYTQIFRTNYLIADTWKMGGALFALGIATGNLILIDSKKATPTITPDTYTEEQAKEYFSNAVANGVFTKWDWNNYNTDPTNYGAYITFLNGDWLGNSGVLNKIVVPDNRYYYYIFSPYVRDALDSNYRSIFDNKTLNNNVQTPEDRVETLKAIYEPYSVFMASHTADFVDADTGKYWWQCNNSLNNVINALYPADNRSGIYSI